MLKPNHLHRSQQGRPEPPKRTYPELESVLTEIALQEDDRRIAPNLPFDPPELKLPQLEMEPPADPWGGLAGEGDMEGLREKERLRLQERARQFGETPPQDFVDEIKRKMLGQPGFPDSLDNEDADAYLEYFARETWKAILSGEPDRPILDYEQFLGNLV